MRRPFRQIRTGLRLSGLVLTTHLLLGLGAGQALAEDAASPPADLADLVEQGHFDDALRIGEARRATPLAEDGLWMGVAAIGAGRVAEGIAQLERFIAEHALNPQVPRARLELGRAYLASGRSSDARAQFEAVLATQPPANVQRNIRTMLSLADLQDKSSETQASGYLEAGLGRDSNSNAGTANALTSLPGLGVVTLNGSSLASPSNYWQIAGGGNVARRLSSEWYLLGLAQLDSRRYTAHVENDLLTASAATGLAWRRSQTQVRFLLTHENLLLGDRSFRTANNLMVDGSLPLTRSDAIDLAAQAGHYDYDGGNAVRNADTWNLGASLRHALDLAWHPTLQAGGSVAGEHNTAARPDLGRRVRTVRLALSLTPAERWSVTGGVTRQSSTYQADDPLLLVTRADTYNSADIGINYRWSDRMSVRADVQRASNHSNADLWQYDRTVAGVKLRYDFR